MKIENILIWWYSFWALCVSDEIQKGKNIVTKDVKHVTPKDGIAPNLTQRKFYTLTALSKHFLTEIL